MLYNPGDTFVDTLDIKYLVVSQVQIEFDYLELSMKNAVVDVYKYLSNTLIPLASGLIGSIYSSKARGVLATFLNENELSYNVARIETGGYGLLELQKSFEWYIKTYSGAVNIPSRKTLVWQAVSGTFYGVFGSTNREKIISQTTDQSLTIDVPLITSDQINYSVKDRLKIDNNFYEIVYIDNPYKGVSKLNLSLL